MSRSFPETLELRQRMFMSSKLQQRLMVGAGAALLLLFVVLALFLFYASPTCRPEDAGSALERIWRGIEKKPWDSAMNALVLVVVLAQLYYFRRAIRFERLILTGTGMEYRSLMPVALKFLQPDWKVAWSQVRAATLAGGKFVNGPQLTTLTLDTGTRKVKVYPWRWIDPETFVPATPWKELRRMQLMRPAAVITEIEEGPVLRYAAAALAHLKIGRSGSLGGMFALEKNHSSLAIVIGFFVLLFYALVDGVFVGEEIYVEIVPWNWFLLAGVAGFVGAAMWMWRSGVPKAEGTIVAVLFGGALGAAAYPGVLRLNALTDTEGLRTYEYVLQTTLTLTPVDPEPPDLLFPQYNDYWRQFKPGSKHEFELRRGGLGFYQLNFEPVRKHLRAYYEQQDRRPGG